MIGGCTTVTCRETINPQVWKDGNLSVMWKLFLVPHLNPELENRERFDFRSQNYPEKRSQNYRSQNRFFMSSYFSPDLKKNWTFGSRIFDVEFGNFLRNIEDSEKKISEKFTRNSTFYLLFSHNLGAKSCNSLVWRRSSLDSALQRRNCSLNTQKQPLF